MTDISEDISIKQKHKKLKNLPIVLLALTIICFLIFVGEQGSDEWIFMKTEKRGNTFLIDKFSLDSNSNLKCDTIWSGYIKK